MSCVKKFYCALLFTFCGHLLNAQVHENDGKKVPITLHGNTGVSYNFYSSNEAVATRPSYSWSSYGNFTAKIDQVTLPFSFVVNQYANSNRSPFFQAGISPTYKWARFHLGDRYMQFSPLIFEGQTFRGVGLELNPKQFRFATFYGKLNKAVDEDTSRNSFRLPQYARTGYGAKIGYGNSQRFVDLIYFHAKDDSSSASFVDSISKGKNLARENAVLGVSTRLTFLKKWVFLADVAVSGLTHDLAAGESETDSLTSDLTKFMSNFMTHNGTTSSDYAGQSSLIFNTPNFNSNLSYRRVEPQFKSLGTPYLINDQELLSWINYFSALAGKITINTNLSSQHNDLDKNLDTKLQTTTGGIFVNAIIDTNYNVNLSYSGYNFRNKAGIEELNDNNRLIQYISQFNFNPSYNFTRGYKLNYISANLAISTLKDKSSATSSQTSNNNLSASLNYTIAFTKKAYNSFSASVVYSNYKQDTTSYSSYGGTIGASMQLLKNKNLNIQGNIGYFFNKFDSNDSQTNLTYSFNASYRLKRHSLSVYSNYIYTPPDKINEQIYKTVPHAVATENFAGGLSYNYNF